MVRKSLPPHQPDLPDSQVGSSLYRDDTDRPTDLPAIRRAADAQLAVPGIPKAEGDAGEALNIDNTEEPTGPEDVVSGAVFDEVRPDELNDEVNIPDPLLSGEEEALGGNEPEGFEFTRAWMDGTATDIDTGGFSPGGVSQDLTQAEFAGSRRMGGPTGGDVYGAGAGGGFDLEHTPDRAEGRDIPPEEEHHDSGLAQRIAAENTARLLSEPHPPERR